MKKAEGNNQIEQYYLQVMRGKTKRYGRVIVPPKEVRPTHILNSEQDYFKRLPGKPYRPKYMENSAFVLRAAKIGRRIYDRFLTGWWKQEMAENIIVDQAGHYWTKEDYYDQLKQYKEEEHQAMMESGYTNIEQRKKKRSMDLKSRFPHLNFASDNDLGKNEISRLGIPFIDLTKEKEERKRRYLSRLFVSSKYTSPVSSVQTSGYSSNS